MTSLGGDAYVGTLHYKVLDPPIIGIASGLPEVLNTDDTAGAGQEIIMASDGIINTPQINKQPLVDTLHIVGKVGVGVNPADPITEDLEVDGNIQVDTAGLGKLVFYDKQAGHEHCEFDGDDDGANGGQAIIKVKRDGGSVETALTIRESGVIEMPSIEIRDLTPDNPLFIGQNIDLGGFGSQSVGYGANAGTNNSGTRQVSVGWSAGRNNGGSRCICIGDSAGENNAGNFSVNIGLNASNGGSGQDAVVIGNNAGRTQADTNCIILNASGANLNSSTAGQFLVNPIRSVQTATNANQGLFWNSGSGEVFVDSLREDITTYTGGSGTTTNLSVPLPSVIVARWVAGPGPANWVIQLPFLSSVPAGTRVKIKNSGTSAGQNVEVRPFIAIGNQIDNSTTAVVLPTAGRTLNGGGGSCIELIAYNASTWLVVGGLQWDLLIKILSNFFS